MRLQEEPAGKDGQGGLCFGRVQCVLPREDTQVEESSVSWITQV